MGTGIGAPTPAARLSTIAMVRACGQVYGHRLLSRRVRVARPDQDHEVALAPLLDLRSMPHAAKRPFALEQRLIGLAAVPEALSQDFRVCEAGAWLVAHVPWTRALHRIRAASADKRCHTYLKRARHTPGLVLARQAFCDADIVT